MPVTVCAGSSSAVSRVPGPPPRMSIEPVAGSSNTMAVTPEPIRASSAWPTRTPGTSVIRLRSAATSTLADSQQGCPQLGARLSRGQRRVHCAMAIIQKQKRQLLRAASRATQQFVRAYSSTYVILSPTFFQTYIT